MDSIATLNNLFKKVYCSYYIPDFVRDEYGYKANLTQYWDSWRFDELHDQTLDMQEKIDDFFRKKFSEFEKTPEYARRNKNYVSAMEQIYNQESPLLKAVEKAPKTWKK